MSTKAQGITIEGKKVTIHFRDDGQDFLEWTVDNGIVTDSDLQAWVWVGTKVLNKEVEPGCSLQVQFKSGTVGMLTHPVEKVVVVD